MKKVLLALAMAIIAFAASAEDTVTGAALTIRSDIQSFLRSEGYAPSIDDDGDIKFKKEGLLYFISVENYYDMVYVATFYMMGIEDCTMSKVRIAADQAQRAFKFVRCDVGDKALFFKVCLPINSVNEYKAMFDYILEILSLARDRCIEEYNN